MGDGFGWLLLGILFIYWPLTKLQGLLIKILDKLEQINKAVESIDYKKKNDHEEILRSRMGG